jgi:hypothetical protein
LTSVLAVASMLVNRPTPSMLVVTPEGGVACAGSMSRAAATSAPTAAMAARMRLGWIFTAAPFRTGRWSGDQQPMRRRSTPG